VREAANAAAKMAQNRLAFATDALIKREGIEFFLRRKGP